MTTGIRVLARLAICVATCFGTVRPSAALVASTCADICAGTGACTVNSPVDVVSGSTLDCSGRDLTIKRRVRVLGGTFALLAKSIVLTSGDTILATEDSLNEVGVEIQVEDSLTSYGKFQANNKGAGSFIRIFAGQDIHFLKGFGVDVRGSASSADGGEIILTAGGSVLLKKPSNGAAPKLYASGQSGGTSDNENSGGDITIEAGLDVEVEGEIETFGRFFDGGSVTIEAGRDVVVDTGAVIDAHGQSLDGFGGEIEIFAGEGLVLNGSIELDGGRSAGGGEGAGGFTFLSAEGCAGVTIGPNSIIDVDGGGADAGSVVVISTGLLTVAGSIHADGLKLDGWGGDIELSSMRRIDLVPQSVVRAVGDISGSSTGRGGIVELSACVVDLQATSATLRSSVLATGYHGGRVVIDGWKENLAAPGQGDFSVHVDRRVGVFASGTDPSRDGVLELGVKNHRLGSCSNKNASFDPICATDNDCTDAVYGSGVCQGLNPHTDQRTSQFVPDVDIFQNPFLPTCGQCTIP